ncbi:MAG: hypothetical protein U5O69_09075 [Candidatus Competibacteraceae bacterium]|nr:hypothetical protein [Candidatus Competibacteraceae bacterium]
MTYSKLFSKKEGRVPLLGTYARLFYSFEFTCMEDIFSALLYGFRAQIVILKIRHDVAVGLSFPRVLPELRLHYGLFSETVLGCTAPVKAVFRGWPDKKACFPDCIFRG